MESELDLYAMLLILMMVATAAGHCGVLPLFNHVYFNVSSSTPMVNKVDLHGYVW